MPVIGIVHSTAFNTVMTTAFNAGLAQNWDTTAHPVSFSNPGPPGGGYGPGIASLQAQVAGLITPPQPPHAPPPPVDLVVAAGGLVAGIAAVAAFAAVPGAANIPFIFISGALTGDLTSPNNVGGVDLNCIGQDEGCAATLHAKDSTINDTNVALIVNANAALTAGEVTAWKNNASHNPNFVVTVDVSKGTDYTTLANQLHGKLNPVGGVSVKGVVISSDPYLYQYRTQLDAAIKSAAGGNFNGWVCWPFALPINDPKSVLCQTQAVLATSSSNANTAYYQLGEKAGLALSNAAAGTPLKIVGVVQWKGATSSWGTESWPLPATHKSHRAYRE